MLGILEENSYLGEIYTIISAPRGNVLCGNDPKTFGSFLVEYSYKFMVLESKHWVERDA